MKECVGEKTVGEILVDAHAHLRSKFDVRDFLLASWKNIRLHGQKAKKVTGVLCVTDEQGEQGYDRLQEFFEENGLADSEGAGDWESVPTAENTTLSAVSASKDRLVIIAGRQLISQENLEVLAIGTRRQFDAGKPTESLLCEISREGALPILPWGFGKWIGTRGRLVEQLLDNPALPPFFLGDSANRPGFWSRPAPFRRAEKQGIKNIPGSDPLPFSGEVQRVGDFGGRISGCLDPETPSDDLKRKLMDRSTNIQSFGSQETMFRFVRKQALMQYRKLIR